MCQKKSVVKLLKSKSSTGIKLNGKDIIKVYQGTFRQDYSTLTSDSAYFYVQDNAVDAFGHVNINQGDTLNIYSDKLNYNGNTKIAILTDNVRMVDKDATLTTNHFTYNTATRIGTYTDGGKLVNKDNVLLSKNGYYFAFTRDSYFRYDVSLTSPDVLVKTDTMRYNTGTKISYFYGPTNIYSIKKGEKAKDRDTLYTENGYYSTGVEQASFGKNNLYHSGTKSLKGDSLFYDKLKGYGRAIKHVTFEDREQKITIKGDLGTYFKADERTLVTKDPYVIMVTEEKDTSKTDSAAKPVLMSKTDSVSKKLVKAANGITMDQVIKNTIPGKGGKLPVSLPADQKATGLKVDSTLRKYNTPQNIHKADSALQMLSKDKTVRAKADSAEKTLRAMGINKPSNTDSLLKKLPGKDQLAKVKGSDIKKAGEVVKGQVSEKLATVTNAKAAKDTGRIKQDSIYMSADTIETRILTYKDLKAYQEQQRLSHIRDTTAKPKKPAVAVKESKFLIPSVPRLAPDTSFYHRDYFGPPKPKPVVKKPAKPVSKRQLMQDSIAKKKVVDSIALARSLEPADTARIRILIAHHHFKMFKSDLQSKSDSMFYSSSDSTIRSYVNPIMWAQGSQLSGDTIFLQLKKKKLDNLRMFPNAFIVNIEKTDSVNFNQVAGKQMRGYFKNNKLSRMVVIGNAESIYFSRDSATSKVNGMQRSLSSRITVDFNNNLVTTLGFYTKPENKYGPLNKFKEDEHILKGFIWKPKERPVSKESIIPSYGRKATATAAKAAANAKGTTAVKGAATKPPAKNTQGAKKIAADSTKTNHPPVNLKTGKDSVKTPLPAIKTVKDSLKKPDTLKKEVKKN